MFNSRSTEKEFLDNFSCTGADLEQNLKELRFINKWLGGNKVTLSALEEILSKNKGLKSMSIADIGCGGGDMLIEMAKFKTTQNLTLQLVGIDANPSILAYAIENTKPYDTIHFELMDVFSENFSALHFDIINCTLFCHHIETKDLISLLKKFKNQTKVAVVINDLHRHPLAYYSISWLTSLFSKSFMVKNDAKLSVLRGFSKNELLEIIKGAGFENYSIKWKWAFRWQLILWK